ncbi:MAG: phage antirepressor KilAC domain-containing protein [Lachnospiraceae bacterium]|nr:phage antirepressor KilAC domain-containing protein [Lachnospiraceae bacterium]
MNELQIFRNEEFGQVRTVEINGEPWFVGKDIAQALGYSNTNDALKNHVDDEDKKMGSETATPYITDSMGRKQYPLFINESGLYSLVLRSDLPGSKKFKRWVTSEVIPSIRKHGAYMTQETIEKALTSPDFLIQLATKLKEEQEKNRALAADNQRMKPKEEYYDELVDRNLLTNFRDTAKEFGVKERDFIELLRIKGYIYRDDGHKLRPYAGKNNGYFALKEYNAKNSDHSGIQTLITAKGREKFRVLAKELKDEQDKEKA